MSDDEHPPGTDELVAVLESAYGEHFDDERRAAVAKRVADFREAAAALREADLENGDEPAFGFRAYRGDE